MNLRLRKSMAVAWLLILISYTSGVSAAEQAFEIVYFPEVIFKGTPLTVHVRAPEKESLQVVFDQKVNSVLGSNGSALREFTILPEKGFELSFRKGQEENGWSFKILEPGFTEELRERDGYLYQGETPVILMPEHRLPPPLDRRWETVEMVENMIQNQKSEITAVRMLVPGGSGLSAYLEKLLPRAAFQSQIPEIKAWFRVHGYLIKKTEGKAEFLVVETDLFDFERGMSPQTWFMKWQFLLQDLRQRCGYTDGLLFGPAYTPETIKWKPVLEVKLQGLAAAHGLRFIDRSLAPRIWQERLHNQLGKTYLLP